MIIYLFGCLVQFKRYWGLTQTDPIIAIINDISLIIIQHFMFLNLSTKPVCIYIEVKKCHRSLNY
jgi:hypothetical protein